MIQYNGIQIHQLPIWLEIILGILLGIFVLFHNYFVSEDKISKHNIMYFVFILGFVYPSIKPIDISLNHCVLIITACITYIFISYVIAKINYQIFINRINNQKFLKTVTIKNGYIEDKNIIDNAFANRFNLICIGRKRNKGFWDTIFRRSGWNQDEIEALFLHEKGHCLIGIPMFIIEILIYYFFFLNLILQFSIISILIYPTLFTFITLSSWLDELLADTNASPFSSTLIEFLKKLNKSSKKSIYLGTVGASSHPPIFLRSLAYRRIFIAILLFVEFVIFLKLF